MKYDILTAFRGYLNSVTDNKNTADRYYFEVDSLFKDVQFSALGDIPVEAIESRLQAVKTKNRFSAAKNGLKHLKAFDSSLNMPTDEFFRENSAKKRNYSKRPTKTIDISKVNRKINANRDVKLKTAFRLMERSGLRVSECAALTKRDISIGDDGTVKIDVKHGKGGSNDVVTVMPDPWLANKLVELTESLNDDDKPFYAAKTMKNKAKSHGLECHDFRRIAAVTYRDGRRDEGEPTADANKKTQEFLRHTRFSVTRRYLRNRKLKFKK